MFNLERSISEWRRQMLAAGIKTPAPLEELEIHLREEIERQTKTGSSERDAFNFALQKIGQARALKTEFKKAGIPVEMRFVQLVGIACGAGAGLFSFWILTRLLTVHEANMAERILGFLAFTSIFLSWRHGYKFLPTIRSQRVRTAVGFACFLASVVGMMLFLKLIPHFVARVEGSEISLGWFLVSFLWAWAAMAILGGTAYGLEKAARKNNEQYV